VNLKTKISKMTPIHYLFAMVCTLLFSESFAQNNLDIFNKKWKLNIDIKQRLKNLPPEELAAYNQMSDNQKRKVENDLISQAEKSTFEFFNDNTFKVEGDVESYEGTWRISEDGKSVVLRTKQGTEESVIIKSISSNLIVLTAKNKESQKELILIPK
jgi:hypothetical protein